MTANAAENYSPDPNFLEHEAANYVAGHAEPRARKGARAEDAAKMLSRVQRRAVWLAVIIGLVSGGLIGGSEIYVRQGLLDGAEDRMSWQEQLPAWGVFLAFAGVVSLVEILILYWLALRAIADIYGIAGTAPPRADARAVEQGLARAGLEFPNPRDSVYGIDPYAYVPSWQLTALALLYRMKVGISSFLVRLLFRRVLSRVLVRGLIPLLAGPLYAIWNAIITWRILREARIRALGPAAVDEFMDEFAPDDRSLDKRLCKGLLHGVAEMMMRARDAHPNYVILLSRLVGVCDVEPPLQADWPAQRKAIGKLSKAKQEQALRALCFAAVIASKVTKSQQKLLREACEAWDLNYPEKAIAAMRVKLLRGEPLRSSGGKGYSNSGSQTKKRAA
jgi:hypothetical protein